MRVCARGNFGGGMEVVAGAWVGRVFGERDFLKKCGHRAHGGRPTYCKSLLKRWLYDDYGPHKGLPPLLRNCVDGFGRSARWDACDEIFHFSLAK